jgi:hypothetical protein
VGYKIRPNSVAFERDLSTAKSVPVVYWEVYEEGVYPSVGGLSLVTKPERIIARNVTKEQARTILREILSEG